MEDGNLVRLSPLRPSSGGHFKSSSSGKSSTPRGGSPSFRRLSSGRSPRRDVRGIGAGFVFQLFRSNRIVLWLLLITLWAYAGFYFQSRWAHGDNKEDLFSGGYGGESSGVKSDNRRDLLANVSSGSEGFQLRSVRNESSLNGSGVVLPKKEGGGVNKTVSVKKKEKTPKRSSRRKRRGKAKVVVEDVERESVQEEEIQIPSDNSTYGHLVGPFGSIEDKILDWSPEKRSGTCDRKGAFARLVWSRKFVLIMHELSMTGAPLAMMELATEFLSCGASVHVIVLSKKGGLMPELSRRKIKVLEDKSGLSFKTAMKADLIIAGSAVCSSWIENYLSRTVLGSTQIMWWIMENRREYFNRSKLALNRVKKLMFLSESQSNQWLNWCKEEHIKLKSEPVVVPLSVNDELAFVAGIPSSLNTPLFTTENMLEKKKLLRSAVRNEMGLTDNDMLIVSLSSINPGKGQFLLLESVRTMIEHGPLASSVKASTTEHDYNSRSLLQYSKKHHLPMLVGYTTMRKTFSNNRGNEEKNLKLLIGSVGSKSNKVAYVKLLLRHLSNQSNLTKSVLWTPATTRVASLYAAADAYVMNSQGLGETFGRVTIEAMAFGLPVLGTDAGGTKEIVEHNVTGLLHPLGRPGAQVLASNLEFLLQNPSARQEMGMKGREKVEKMYLKRHMFQKFGEVLYKCMRIK